MHAMSACDRCGAPTPAGARFCPACGAAVAETPATSHALKTVTVVFTDIVDSTALGERFDPESLHTVMREYFDAIRGVVERYGGSVEKFIGDAVVAVFGIPALHEDDPLRAVSAASAVHRAVGELSERLRREAGVAIEVHTGVNTGEVLSQPEAGTSGRLVGDAVALAAHLQEAAGPGEILLGPATHRLVEDRVLSESLESLHVKRRTTPAYRLVEVLPAPLTLAKPRASIVGRDREVRLLRETLQRVVEDRTPHLFTVLGAPGIGKSRLVAELEDDEHALVLSARCLPYGDGITYWPLAEIVQKAAGIESDEASGTALRKIAASVGGDDEAAAVAERVAQVVGLSDDAGTTDDLFWAIRRYFERLASAGPLVLVFDDVHWAEPTMLDLIDHLVDSEADVPLLVVCMARLDLLEVFPTWGGGKLNASSLVLGPLKEADCRVLIGSLLGESPSLDQVADAVFPVADGNPLFVEEMISMLVDNGLLGHVEGQWQVTRPLASLEVPPTIQALVSARLDRLSQEEREVLGIAAVMGKVFAPGAVTDLASGSIGDRVDPALDMLVGKQLVTLAEAEFAGSRMYSFRHLLIRDTAYEHLPRMTRAAIHERYADWLVKVLGERIAGQEEIVGYHLEQAHRYQSQVGGLVSERADLATRAAERLAEGGRRALARQDAAAAVKLLSRAAELLPADAAERLSVLPDLGRALFETARYADAMEVFEGAITLGDRLGDARTATTCRIFRERARLHRDPQVNAEELRAVAEDAIEVLATYRDDYGLCHAWDLVAYVHDCAGRSDDALEALRRAAAHAERSGVRSLIGYQRRALVRLLAWGPGTVDEVLRLARDLLEWAREVDDRYSQTRALLTIAQAEAMLGNFEVARDHLRLQRQLCADATFAFAHATGAFERAQVELLAGDVDAAEAEARGACETLEKMGEKAVLPSLQVALADLLYEKGSLDEAAALVDRARDLSAPDDSLTEMKWRSVEAKVLAARGRIDEATELAADAVTIASSTGYYDWHAGVLVDLSDVMVRAGRVADAGDALREARSLYLRKGNVVSASAVAGRLGRLPAV